MNSKQRVDAVIRGEMPDRVPVCRIIFFRPSKRPA
jgi:hypothetical protein